MHNSLDLNGIDSDRVQPAIFSTVIQAPRGRKRLLAEHTAAHRAAEFEQYVREAFEHRGPTLRAVAARR